MEPTEIQKIAAAIENDKIFRVLARISGYGNHATVYVRETFVVGLIETPEGLKTTAQSAPITVKQVIKLLADEVEKQINSTITVPTSSRAFMQRMRDGIATYIQCDLFTIGRHIRSQTTFRCDVHAFGQTEEFILSLSGRVTNTPEKIKQIACVLMDLERAGEIAFE